MDEDSKDFKSKRDTLTRALKADPRVQRCVRGAWVHPSPSPALSLVPC